MKQIFTAIGLFGASLIMSGCVVAAAGAAGAIAADEINENDGKFDPLEDAYDGDEDTEVLTTGDKKDDD